MTFYKSVKEEIQNRGMDCVPMSQDVREMRMDAVRQAEEAFMDGREQMYAALQAGGELLPYGITGLRHCQRTSHSGTGHMCWI